jgi:hypothetical protein
LSIKNQTTQLVRALRFFGTFLFVVIMGTACSAQAQTQFERFAGYLQDSSGQALAGGTVSVNGTSVTSEGDGYFEIYTPTRESYLIKASKLAYVPYSDTYIGPGNEQMEIRLLNAEGFTVDPRQTVDVTDSRGTRLVIAPGSLVNTQGVPATGPLLLSLRTFDLNSEEMIGDMTAVNAQGQRVVLQSLGAFSAEFTDANGNPYNLAPGRTARITIPVDPANSYSGPVPLWYFSETLGYWVEEGMGVVQNGVATGDVPHFSAWNFDLQFTSSACTRLSIAPSVFTLVNPNDPFSGYNPVRLRFRVLMPGWPRTMDINVPAPSSSAHILYALPPSTAVEVYLDGTAYTLYDTGAPWTGTASSTNSYIPRNASQCNSSLYIDNRTPKVATVTGQVTRQHRSNHAGILVTLTSGTLNLSTTTDAAGNFSIMAPTNPNTVSVTASRAGYLSARRASATVTAGGTVTLPAIALLAGDVSGDNCVDWVSDIQAIGNALGTAANSNDRRDVNGNLQIDFDDLSRAAANGGLCGPSLW